ncbi:MAG: peroxiredoxin-like family protein [Stellaceae bacterium]
MDAGKSTMSLQQELDALRAEFVRTAPAGRAALYDAKVEELQRSFPIEQALKTGDQAPDFTLPNPGGRAVSLASLLRGGPAVVTFYRGGWCPYCNLQLRAYQQSLDEITALGGRMVAISPQLSDGSLSTAEINKLSFEVLSDVGNHVARSFGLVYALPDELRAALTSNNKALPDINGDNSWELPLPATYVVAPDHKIALAEIELDYRERLEPEAIVAALRSLRAGAIKAA